MGENVVNKGYSVTTLRSIRLHLESQGSLPCVTLVQFLDKSIVKELKSIMRQTRWVSDQEFLLHSRNISSQIPALLTSHEVRESLQLVTGKKPKKWLLESYGHRDYTILSDHKRVKGETFECILDLTHMWPTNAGGELVYVNGEGDFLEIPPSYGTLTVAKVSQNRHVFMRYCNHHCGKNKRIILRVLF